MSVLPDLKGGNITVIGDVMLDRFWSGASRRVSPEAPVPVVQVQRESMALGGAGNVVRNAIALGAQCGICAVVGDDQAGDRVVDLLKDLGVRLGGEAGPNDARKNP